MTFGRARLVRTTGGLCAPIFGSKIIYAGKSATYVCRTANGDSIERYLIGDPYHGSKPWTILAITNAVALGKSGLADAVDVHEIWWW